MAKSSAPKTKEERAARRSEVKDFIETLGPYSIPVKSLAEKYDVSLQLIYGDIKFWLKKINFKGVELQGRKLIQHAIKNLAIVEELRAKGLPMERIRAVQASCQAADEVVKLLEGFGYKEKIADNLNVVADMPVTINLIEKSVEEIKRDKLANKSKADGDTESTG